MGLEKVNQHESTRDLHVLNERPCRTHTVHDHAVESRTHVRSHYELRLSFQSDNQTRLHSSTRLIPSLQPPPRDRRMPSWLHPVSSCVAGLIVQSRPPVSHQSQLKPIHLVNRRRDDRKVPTSRFAINRRMHGHPREPRCPTRRFDRVTGRAGRPVIHHTQTVDRFPCRIGTISVRFNVGRTECSNLNHPRGIVEQPGRPSAAPQL